MPSVWVSVRLWLNDFLPERTHGSPAPGYSSALRSASRRRFGRAPTIWEMTSPSRKTLSVGIARTAYRPAVTWFSSTSIFATVSVSLSSAAISSRTGESMWHGGHHWAQKSTTTGLPNEEDTTRSWNVSSVTVMTALAVFALLIVPLLGCRSPDPG